jgi:hypothetical protein
MSEQLEEVLPPVKKPGKPLPPDQYKIAAEQVKAMDFAWWYHRKTIGQARQMLNNQLDFRVTGFNFRLLVTEHCEWFQTKRLVSASHSVNLSYDEWQCLRWAVNHHRERLQGRTLGEAIAIVSTTFRCNAKTLRGLNKDLQVWVDN